MMDRSDIETAVWKHATHIRCVMCSHRFKNDGDHDLDFKVESEADLDDAYDDVLCCGDQFLQAEIVSEKPLYPEDDRESEVNQDAFVAYNPGAGIYGDQWHYTVNEDLIDALELAGTITSIKEGL